MKEFIEKYKNDHKYKTKINFFLSLIFVIIITIYAASLNTSTINNNYVNEIYMNTDSDKIIEYKDDVHYTAKININGKIYEFDILEHDNKTEISKTTNDIKKNYIYAMNSYYVKQQEDYIMTTKEEVFEGITTDYINLKNINQYLKKATKQDNQYLVNLKDIILGIDSDEYFVIIKNGNRISIDYLPLIKHFNSEVNKYNVDITIIDGI